MVLRIQLRKVRKFFITFGDVINLTPWLSDEDLIENALIDRHAGLYEHPDRTRDDTDADLHLTDADTKYEYAPTACKGHKMLDNLLH